MALHSLRPVSNTSENRINIRNFINNFELIVRVGIYRFDKTNDNKLCKIQRYC